jgi:heme/copper-type cytochrome/quinol oxidase subunit 2
VRLTALELPKGGRARFASPEVNAMAQPAVRSVRVSLGDDGMEPHEIQIPANYPIRFEITNSGSNPHEFAIPAASYAIDVLPGQTSTVVWTFVDVGRFQIVSRDGDDERHGLRGELIVESLFG